MVQVPASLSPGNYYSSPGQMSDQMVQSQMYHQSNLTMPDMGLVLGMKPDVSPPTPRSLRLMPNTGYGPSSEELRRAANMQAMSMMQAYGQDNMHSQHYNQGASGSQDRAGIGGLNVTPSAAAAMAAAKKKGLKSSLGRLFSKKEKVRRTSLFSKVKVVNFIFCRNLNEYFLMNDFRRKERMSCMTMGDSTVKVR